MEDGGNTQQQRIIQPREPVEDPDNPVSSDNAAQSDATTQMLPAEKDDNVMPNGNEGLRTTAQSSQEGTATSVNSMESGSFWTISALLLLVIILATLVMTFVKRRQSAKR